jgi:hypothetical protein
VQGQLDAVSEDAAYFHGAEGTRAALICARHCKRRGAPVLGANCICL